MILTGFRSELDAPCLDSIVFSLPRSFWVRASNRDGVTGSGFAIRDTPCLPLKNPDIPEGGVRGACSSGALYHTKHRDHPVRHRAVFDSSECREVTPVLRARAYSPMPVHRDLSQPDLCQIEHLLHSSGNPCAGSRFHMSCSQKLLEAPQRSRVWCSWWRKSSGRVQGRVLKPR